MATRQQYNNDSARISEDERLEFCDCPCECLCHYVSVYVTVDITVDFAVYVTVNYMHMTH